MRGLMETAAIGVAVVFVLALGVRLYMGRAAEDRVAPDERVSLRELRPPLPQNAFLACPPGYCAAAAAPSPIFAMPWTRLREDWADILGREPRVVRVAAGADGKGAIWIQHSLLFRFPDIITVEYIALGPERSSLAVYSRARYGKSDFGTNRRRVERWLALLRKADVRLIQPARP
jgi:uncharacterized protein (DUF1499 family)